MFSYNFLLFPLPFSIFTTSTDGQMVNSIYKLPMLKALPFTASTPLSLSYPLAVSSIDLLLEMVLPVVCLVVLLCNSCALVGSLNDEGLALLSFKTTITNKFSGDSLSTWNSSDVNPCSWDGIKCQKGKVVTLSIAKKKLKGQIHPALGTLSAIRHINLKNNNFFGSLPVQLLDPRGLQSLVLSGNSLSGSIPSEIGKLRYLQNFDISHNLFNGSIPHSLLHCKRLKTLDLSQNNFTASLPDGFGASLIALQKLNLSFNKLTGFIPYDIGNLLSLQQSLDLSHNLFTGLIPASLGSLPETVYIDLSFNNLSGPIPQNSALANRGPTAFIGNPFLCGSPLKVPCSSITPDILLPYPSQNSGHSTGKSSNLSTVAVVSIVAGAMVGIGLIGFLFSSYYQNYHRRKNGEIVGGCNSLKGLMGRNKEWFCFGGKDNSKSLAEHDEPYDLVPLDLQVNFDLDELLKANSFVMGKSIFGIVYKVVLDNGPTLAVRRLGDGDFQRFKDFQIEVEAIGKVRHPNIVPLRAYCWSAHEKLLIYDYMPNGDLASTLHGKAGMGSYTPLSWHVRLKIMKGIATGLAYLHEFSPKKYVHGDLKPSNILLGPNMEAHIADFGLGRLVNAAGGSPTLEYRQTMTFETPEQNSPYEFTAINSTMAAGTYYQAPEAFKVPKPLQKWDVYSYGVILLEMVSGKSPMNQGGSSGKELVRWIRLCVEEKETLAKVLDPFLVRYLGKEEEIVGVLKIALACAEDSPEKRPSMRQVCDAFDKLATSIDFCLY